MTLKSISRTPSVVAALLALPGDAYAVGGTIRSVSATPNVVFSGERVNFKVGVTAGGYGVSGNLR